jgi:(p)ppGpp synthase/HD superfamily hydrolase
MQPGERFIEALAYAVRLHAGQVRKQSGAPYVSHLLRVAGTVLEHGADEDEAIAALLHDAIEDQGGAAAYAQIRERFGRHAADLVAACSDADQTPKPPWRRRKEAYLARLARNPAAAQRISAADKLDNVRALIAGHRAVGDAMWSHFRGGRDGTLWYHRSVVDVLQKTLPGALVDELARAVAELEQLND